MELPIFLLNDVTGGVSAYHDREMLDAAIISEEDGQHLTAWASDGERLVLSVHPDRWQIASAEPRVFDIELLRDLLFEHLKYQDEATASHIARDRIIERAGIYFAIREPRSGWQVFAENLAASVFQPW